MLRALQSLSEKSQYSNVTLNANGLGNEIRPLDLLWTKKTNFPKPQIIATPMVVATVIMSRSLLSIPSLWDDVVELPITHYAFNIMHLTLT